MSNLVGPNGHLLGNNYNTNVDNGSMNHSNQPNIHQYNHQSMGDSVMIANVLIDNNTNYNQMQQTHLQQQQQQQHQQLHHQTNGFDFDFLNLSDTGLDKNLLNLNMLEFQTTMQTGQQQMGTGAPTAVNGSQNHMNNLSGMMLDSHSTNQSFHGQPIGDDYWYQSLNQPHIQQQQHQQPQQQLHQQHHNHSYFQQQQQQQQQHQLNGDVSVQMKSNSMVTMMPPPVHHQQHAQHPPQQPKLLPSSNLLSSPPLSSSSSSSSSSPSSLTPNSKSKAKQPKGNQSATAKTANNTIKKAPKSRKAQLQQQQQQQLVEQPMMPIQQELKKTNAMQAASPQPSSSSQASSSMPQSSINNLSHLILSVQPASTSPNISSPNLIGSSSVSSPSTTLFMLSPPPSANSASSTATFSSLCNTNKDYPNSPKHSTNAYQNYSKPRQSEVAHARSLTDKTKSKHHRAHPLEQENNQLEKANSEEALYCSICELGFQNAHLKHEHMNSNQHLSMQVLRLKEGNRPVGSHLMTHGFPQQVLHQPASLNANPAKMAPAPQQLNNIRNEKTVPLPPPPLNDCCLLAHREYFDINAYHAKIIERSVLASNEFKAMKLKQSAIKLDNRKSNQTLKTLKNELDKKQTYLTNLSKANAAYVEQLNLCRHLVEAVNKVSPIVYTAPAINGLKEPPKQQQPIHLSNESGQEAVSTNQQEQVYYINQAPTTNTQLEQSTHMYNTQHVVHDQQYGNHHIHPHHHMQQQQQQQQQQDQYQQAPSQFIGYMGQQQSANPHQTSQLQYNEQHSVQYSMKQHYNYMVQNDQSYSTSNMQFMSQQSQQQQQQPSSSSSIASSSSGNSCQ